MLFNSLEFLIFFPVVVGVYFLTPFRHRWAWLLAASYFFYMSWRAEYLILIVIATGVNYLAGLQMGKATQPGRRKAWLVVALSVSLGMLFLFKYLDLFTSGARTLLAEIGVTAYFPVFELLLPVGISFYTFQALSYAIDVYRGNKEPERHLGIFAVYVAFFPQLVAGPIERAVRLLPQFHVEHKFDLDRAIDGLKLMAWGYWKKVIIADRLAVAVDFVYSNPAEHTGISLTIATILFALQIYCDFSGYSDIAIGAAQVMGFRLMVNFRQPYLSRSIPEFWRRWHISLSTWFRDYLYVPLGGNRVPLARWQLNILTVFVVSGLWHGANWTFIIWGALHGLYMLLDFWIRGLRGRVEQTLRLERLPRLVGALKVAVTFALVCFAWIFFRANSVSEAFYIATHWFRGWGQVLANLGNLAALRQLVVVALPSPVDWLIAIAGLSILLAVDLLQQRGSVRALLGRQPIWLRWPLYYGLVFSIIMFGQSGGAQFIYFQF